MTLLRRSRGGGPARRRPERLGEVTAPSGVVLVIDMGLLHFWSHDRPPLMQPWQASLETVASANSSIDLRIEGPDAAEAGRRFDLSGNPLYLFDRPPPGAGLHIIQRKFRACVRKHGLEAKLVRLPERVTHRRRVDLIREVYPAGGEVQFQGIWAVAVSDIPTDRPLQVIGERMPGERYATRWRHVSLVCRRGSVARSEKVGMVMVDEARLMFADVDALGAWRHDEALDGLADFIFWGQDAAKAARRVKAPQLGDEVGEFGWTDLPAEEATRRARRVDALCQEKGWVMGRDFRPHSHHHEVMQQVRVSPTASGMVEVGGAVLCGFMTSWGDGIYHVFRDLDADGRLVRVRIDLGSDETVKRMEAVEERYFGIFAQFAIVSRRVLDDGRPVGFLYREAPDNSVDSGWRVFAGDESRAYTNKAGNAQAVPLRELVDRDKALEEIFRTPAPCAFERRKPDKPFKPVEDFFDPDTGRPR